MQKLIIKLTFTSILIIGFTLGVLSFDASKASAAPPLYLPWTEGATYQVTQGNFGSYSHLGNLAYAWDFGLPAGTNLRASAQGTVVAMRNNCPGYEAGSWGNYVLIYHGNGTYTRYAHLQYSSIPGGISYGSTVRRGQVIGRSGNTGYSFGDHLHFQVENSNGVSIPAYFMDAGIPGEGRWVTSSNREVQPSGVHETTTVGVYDPATATFYLRHSNTPGHANNTFVYGNGGSWIPITGDWNGYGTTTVGVYDPATATFYLKDSNSSGHANNTFGYGNGGSWIPITGDWTGHGAFTVGVYDPATATFYLRDSNSSGNANNTFGYGNGGSWIPLTGDWNGDGTTTVGLYDPATTTFYLRNSNTSGNADYTFGYGNGGSWIPLTGDWNGDGTTTVGVYDPATATFYLRNSNTPGHADNAFVYGNGGSWVPLYSSGYPNQSWQPPGNPAPPAPGDYHYYFTWYDNVYARNWVLAANPSSASATTTVGVQVAGVNQSLGTISGMSPGMVPSGAVLSNIFPGTMGGPVSVRASSKAVVSQRVLWGNSLEEVAGVDEARLSNHYYWPWYDHKTPGYKNWVLVANPGSSPVNYEIRVSGTIMANGTIGPGQNVTPSFPGIIGGPVEVFASNKVIASQRVLAGSDSDFTEVPGIPAEDLSNSYLWSWYDMLSPGAKDWVLVANPNNENVDYEVKVDGSTLATGTLSPGEQAIPTFPGSMGGPVEVTASNKVIASQRVTWGASFDELTGFSREKLKAGYAWTWYDQKSPGSQNWVIVANPGATNVSYEIRIAGNKVASGSLKPGERVTPAFPATMNGPVEVTASAPVMASQRVLWNGYFNEVVGM